MTTDRLIPVNGTWVKSAHENLYGIVVNHRQNGNGIEVQVRWIHNTGAHWMPLHAIRSGFQAGMEVQDIPLSRTRKTLGEGVVLAQRRMGQRDQVLVEFPESGRSIWLPFENLQRIKGPRYRFEMGETGSDGNAERFRLRCLAHALEMWQENTGSLSRLDIDPLPHQIHLVHHILRSGNLNWLIGDDVGLGKTIEVGMLLSALKQRGTFRRILIVTPAGLVRQWQEELYHRFGMEDFKIYGTDFEIHHARHWKMYDHVIGSIDRLKLEAHLDTMLQAGAWDLIVFDEAHRLSRRQWGAKYDPSERFRLAAALRQTTDALLLLTGTPHQGMQDKFQALLELLRPELKEQIQRLSLNPEILREIVIRNHKADVTDAEGNFIFQGTVTRALQVPTGHEAEAFDRDLQHYLREGYAAGRKLGREGLAIGFVMTVYRKLAASSIAAIQMALQRRLQKILGQTAAASPFDKSPELVDDRFIGEEDEQTDTSEREFFDGEIRLLEELLGKAAEVKKKDLKLQGFLDDLLPGTLNKNKREKLLIFTEYRATQDYVRQALESRYGVGSVYMIHGGQTYQEREQAIWDFENTGQFLISTEAGGEGLNLHRHCHMMVNYDLPWNPMRLVQRMGRLYRYGQQKKVIVFNLLAPHTFDAKIRDMMYDRINQVIRDMASVGREFQQGLEDEILGEIAEMLDVEEILEEAYSAGIKRTRERIEEALQKAREAALKQRELLNYASRFDPEKMLGQMTIGKQHVMAFLIGMFDILGIEILDRTHGGRVLDIRLPEDVRTQIPERQQRLRITIDREFAIRNSRIRIMDFNDPFFSFLVQTAKTHAFDGICANLSGLPGKALITAMLRWQNDQGMRMRQEFAAVVVHETGTVDTNPDLLYNWLLNYLADGAAPPSGHAVGREIIKKALEEMDCKLAKASNAYIHPENLQIINAGWCG